MSSSTWTIVVTDEKHLQQMSEVHVQSWREAYAGILPGDYLKALSVESRLSMWRKIIQSPTHFGRVVIEDHRVIGFVSAGPMRGTTPIASHEIYALYLLKAYQGQGIGKRLVEVIFEHLQVDKLTAWVLKDNPSCRFYEKLKGSPVDSQFEDIGGKSFEEVCYLIPNYLQ